MIEHSLLEIIIVELSQILEILVRIISNNSPTMLWFRAQMVKLA